MRRWPVVGAAMSDSTTSGSPPSASISFAGRVVVEEIHLQHGRARHRVHAEIVDADDARAARPCDFARAAATWHQPPGAAPRSMTFMPGFRMLVAVVDLDQLVGGARAIALGLGALHIGVVDVALQPAARRFLQAALLLDRGSSARACRRPGLLRLLGHGRAPPRQLRRQTPSSPISSLRMPSRRPRSATRSRSDGQTPRIASRMAQPASTRSARSAPMQGLATRCLEIPAEQLLDHARRRLARSIHSPSTRRRS